MSSELEKNYKKAFNKKLGFGKNPALILVDFVSAYFDVECPLFANVNDVLLSAIRIRDKAREVNVPIFYTNVSYDSEGRNGGVFFEKIPALEHFIVGRDTAGWPRELLIDPGETIITKQYPSAFFETDLVHQLNQNEIDTLIITGLTTSGCVRATCVDAISYGFRPIIVEEACGDRHIEPHLANLFDMNAKYGDVISEVQIIQYLAREQA